MQYLTVFLLGALYNGIAVFKNFFMPSFSVQPKGRLSLQIMYNKLCVISNSLAPPAKISIYNISSRYKKLNISLDLKQIKTHSEIKMKNKQVKVSSLRS